MSTGCAERWLLLQADLDGALDAGRSAELATHVAGCAGCAALRGRLLALDGRARAGLPFHAAPAALRARLEAQLAPPPQTARPNRRQALRYGIGAALAASLAVVLLPRGRAPDPAPDPAGDPAGEVVANHIRALQAGHLLDVVSTDRHTVKPWFEGRLDFAPPVRDLTGQGFPLEGGRLDYLAGRPVAALVYRQAKHAVQVFAWPATGEQAPTPRSQAGYALIRWTEGGMAYWAIADIAPEDLAAFVRAFRAAG